MGGREEEQRKRKSLPRPQACGGRRLLLGDLRGCYGTLHPPPPTPPTPAPPVTPSAGTDRAGPPTNCLRTSFRALCPCLPPHQSTGPQAEGVSGEAQPSRAGDGGGEPFLPTLPPCAQSQDDDELGCVLNLRDGISWPPVSCPAILSLLWEEEARPQLWAGLCGMPPPMQTSGGSREGSRLRKGMA